MEVTLDKDTAARMGVAEQPEVEVFRCSEQVTEMGPYRCTATYTRTVAVFDADYYGFGLHTYCRTRWYRNGQLLSAAQDGNYKAIRQYMQRLGVTDYRLV